MDEAAGLREERFQYALNAVDGLATPTVPGGFLRGYHINITYHYNILNGAGLYEPEMIAPLPQQPCFEADIVATCHAFLTQHYNNGRKYDMPGHPFGNWQNLSNLGSYLG